MVRLRGSFSVVAIAHMQACQPSACEFCNGSPHASLAFYSTKAAKMTIRSFVFLIALLSATLTSEAATHTCSNLRHRSIAPADIALPTRGGFVRSAQHERGNNGGYCRVLGQIDSIDVAADPIRFEVNLPEKWNGKALQFGGGGFDGYLRQSDGRRETILGDKGQPTPLALGYTTFGSDSGHHKHYLLLPEILNELNGQFAVNDEQRQNFGSDSLKKTHDVAMVLMQAHYDAKPTRMYFIGGSTGGREALKAVDRWPEDYDGVLAAYAAWNQSETNLQFMRISQAMYAKGKNGQAGWLPTSKTKLLRQAVLQTCDAQDGLVDHIVSNPHACSFNPATLRCKDGRDHRGCLSDGQERTVSAFSEPQISTFTVDNGMYFNPGYNVLRGSDLVGNMGWCRHPYHPALPLLNSLYYVFGDGIVRSFLARGPQVSLFAINTKDGGAVGHSLQEYMPRVQMVSAELDASLADLSPFEQHGGKLLLIHGVADSTIPTESSVFLYSRIVAAMGQKRADEFVRLYLIPGMGHGLGVFYAGFDTIGVLDRWADDNEAPVNLTIVDQNKRGHRRDRPMCLWPTWPRFVGGNPDVATSFVCALNPGAK